ncbi:MAG TPA: hypothetical protein G4N92_05455 [Anaerolineae bacterium]|nr:hypothetical protein [Anaerolineae bacterium]
MNLSKTRELTKNPLQWIEKLRLHSQTVYTLITLAALVSFEAFNYSTTDFALRDLLGDLGFSGLRWSTILALAFCGMDFAGIARLFTPQDKGSEGREGWFLLSAWLLAATMNACLTWWGVSIAIYNHPVESVLVVDPMTIVTVVPIFVAIMVWVIRILIIGSLASALNRILYGDEKRPAKPQPIASRPFGFKPPAPKPVATFRQRPVQPRGMNTNTTNFKAEHTKHYHN